MTTVRFVVPPGVDDPARPTGGNVYDRRVRDGLRARGWDVRMHPADDVAGFPDGALVLVDGLAAAVAGPALSAAAERLRIVVLVHMPLGGVEVPADDEARALASADAVVTTSAWTRQALLDRYGLPSDRIVVARPGADRLDAATGTPGGGRFLCVATLAPHKGHDVLLAALARLADLPWACTLAGSLDRDPAYVRDLCTLAVVRGIADRVRFAGPLDDAALRREYRTSDLLVHPSRLEAYGMVVAEALGAGLPVVATTVGGVPEALGRAPSGVPGRLVPPSAPDALAGSLREWLGDADLRDRLRRAARERRSALEGWDATTGAVADVLDGVRTSIGVGA